MVEASFFTRAIAITGLNLEFAVILLPRKLIHIYQHRIFLDRWTCSLAFHFFFFLKIIKIMTYIRRKLFVMLKIFGKLPRTWVNQTPYNIRFNVNYISCSINYTMVGISYISGLSQGECQHEDHVLMMQQTNYTEICKIWAFEKDQALGCKWFPSRVLQEPISKPAATKGKTSADFSGHWIHITFWK